MLRNPKWNEYVEQTAAGDREALAKLYDESRHLVFGLITRILGNTADSEEICIDVYLQVWRTARTFDPRRGSAAVWLVVLARSRAIDRLRKSGLRRKLERSDAESQEAVRRQHSSDSSPDQLASSKQEATQIGTALQSLDPKERQVIELAYFAGLSQTEIAANLDEPLGTVKTYIRRALSKLRAGSLGAPLECVAGKD